MNAGEPTLDDLVAKISVFNKDTIVTKALSLIEPYNGADIDTLKATASMILTGKTVSVPSAVKVDKSILEKVVVPYARPSAATPLPPGVIVPEGATNAQTFWDTLKSLEDEINRDIAEANRFVTTGTPMNDEFKINILRGKANFSRFLEIFKKAFTSKGRLGFGAGKNITGRLGETAAISAVDAAIAGADIIKPVAPGLLASAASKKAYAGVTAAYNALVAATIAGTPIDVGAYRNAVTAYVKIPENIAAATTAAATSKRDAATAAEEAAKAFQGITIPSKPLTSSAKELYNASIGPESELYQSIITSYRAKSDAADAEAAEAAYKVAKSAYIEGIAKYKASSAAKKASDTLTDQARVAVASSDIPKITPPAIGPGRKRYTETGLEGLYSAIIVAYANALSRGIVNPFDADAGTIAARTAYMEKYTEVKDSFVYKGPINASRNISSSERNRINAAAGEQKNVETILREVVSSVPGTVPIAPAYLNPYKEYLDQYRAFLFTEKTRVTDSPNINTRRAYISELNKYAAKLKEYSAAVKENSITGTITSRIKINKDDIIRDFLKFATPGTPRAEYLIRELGKQTILNLMRLREAPANVIAPIIEKMKTLPNPGSDNDLHDAFSAIAPGWLRFTAEAIPLMPKSTNALIDDIYEVIQSKDEPIIAPRSETAFKKALKAEFDKIDDITKKQQLAEYIKRRGISIIEGLPMLNAARQTIPAIITKLVEGFDTYNMLGGSRSKRRYTTRKDRGHGRVAHRRHVTRRG